MEENALKWIQFTALEANGTNQKALDAGKQIVLSKEVEIHDLEKFQPGRRRFRGALKTDSLSDFVLYIKRHMKEAPIAGTEGAPGFIDAIKLSATVLFNLGTATSPGHADDTATLTLKPSAPYAAICAINGKHLAHKDAIDWLEDWAENISYLYQAGIELSPQSALTAIRKITIRATTEKTTSQEDFRATRSALEDVEARGAVELPSEVLFTCTPYAGLPSRTFRLRLAVLTTTDKPVLVLRVRNLEAEQEAIAQDFKAALLRDLEGDAALTIGTFTP